MARELSASKREQARDNLRSVFQDQMMKATVVKDAEYSQVGIIHMFFYKHNAYKHMKAQIC